MPASIALLALALGATLDVPPGGDLTAALDAARPGDVVRLAAGTYSATLGRRAGPLRLEGAGPEATLVSAPEGADGLVVTGGEVTLGGVALRAGPARAALKVLGGRVHLEDVALLGGAAGAYVEDGALEGRGALLEGEWGLLARGAEVTLEGGSARGARAGVALLSGRLSLRRFSVTGPAGEAGVSVSGGSARLEDVVVRSPGPSGLTVSGGARVDAVALEISGAREQGAILGDCVQVQRATLRLSGSTLTRCAGAAIEADRAEVALAGVDVVGGDAGGLVLVNGSTADLEGNRCTGPGPALVASSGSKASLRMNRWLTDPVLWVECGSGARVKVGAGEQVGEPCRNAADPLDRSARP